MKFETQIQINISSWITKQHNQVQKYDVLQFIIVQKLLKLSSKLECIWLYERFLCVKYRE